MTITAVQCRCCGMELEYEGCVYKALVEIDRLREMVKTSAPGCSTGSLANGCPSLEESDE